MKLSKSLMQSILVGVTIGTATSCSMLDSITGGEEEECTVLCGETDDLRRTANGVNTCYDCPGCGLG